MVNQRRFVENQWVPVRKMVCMSEISSVFCFTFFRITSGQRSDLILKCSTFQLLIIDSYIKLVIYIYVPIVAGHNMLQLLLVI